MGYRGDPTVRAEILKAIGDGWKTWIDIVSDLPTYLLETAGMPTRSIRLEFDSMVELGEIEMVPHKLNHGAAVGYRVARNPVAEMLREIDQKGR